MAEDALVRLAEVGLLLPADAQLLAVAEAAGVAEAQVFALRAHGRHVLGRVDERAERRPVEHLLERLLQHVAHAVSGLDEEIARVDVTVPLDGDQVRAVLAVLAALRRQAEELVQPVVDRADVERGVVVLDPGVEQAEHEVAVLLGAHGVLAHRLGSAGRTGRSGRLRAGDELRVVQVVLDKELEDAARVGQVGLADDDQHVELHVVALQQVDGPHGALVDGLAAHRAAHGVDVRRAVHADADQEVLLGQELRPVLVEQHAVGLQAVAPAVAGAGLLALDLDGAAEEVEAHQGRLAALPADLDLARLQGAVLLADGGEYFGGDARAGLVGVEVVDRAVVAVVASHVAVMACGLDQDAQIGFSHRPRARRSRDGKPGTLIIAGRKRRVTRKAREQHSVLARTPWPWWTRWT